MKTIKTHTHLSSLIQMNNVKRFCSNKNNRIKSFTLAVFIVFAISTTGQNLEECGTFIDTTEIYQPSRFFDYSSDTWLYKYRTPGFWIPNSTTPIKTVLVNWVICRDDNGGNGWQDSQTFRDEVDRMFENINHVYSTSLPKGYSLTCEPQYTHIYDSRIRFELNEIIFIDSTVFNQCGVGQMPMIFSIVDYVHNHYPSSSKALTHIFTQPYNPIYPNAWGQYDAYYNSYSFVITQGSMADPSSVVWPEHVAHITHEYGHAVGLAHTYDGERTCLSHFDFLDDVFGNCSENIDPCEHQSQTCDGDNVCYLPKTWFEGNTPPYPLMSGCMYSSRYISPKSMGRMHRALSLYDYRFICPNGAMHKYVKEKYSYIYPLTVSTDETWDFAIKMYQDIVVTNDATLTITGEVKMPIDGKIIVHPGAKLIIDGGRITSAHDLPWSGIEVWGNKNVHQYEINGSYGQGYLELKNGAVIENAKCAVELWRPNYWGTTGGIIHATDATFRNCAKAVHALYYTNHSYINGLETAYNSSFKNCNFIIDENYLGSQTFNKHVDLAQVNGISFKGCAFSVNRKIQGVSLWCVGIGAYQAGFTVSSFCNAGNSSTTTEPCPEEYLVPSTFSGFYHGIHASNDGSAARTFNVWNSILSNNTIGIFALNTGYATIVNNEFVVGCGSDCDFGIYAEAVTGFCIEENSFYPRAINHGSPYGIEIVGSLGNNDIYGNHFQGLHCGNVAVGNNIVTSESSMANTLGLTYSCNTNTNNTIDFCVLKDSNGHGDIASQQGSMYQPSGNTFNGDLYHFYNDGSQLIDYYYNSNENSQIPDPDLLYRVSRHSTTSPNQCTSHYGNSSLVKSNSEKNQLATDYLSHYTTYSNLKQVYENKIDGGNTSLQVSDINNASTSDQWRLRAHLLELAPYTSADVLTATIDRYDVFSNPVLFEILSANPDELKKDTLIRYLENKENPLPDYMVDILRQVADGFTARTALEAQMGKYGHDYTLAAGDIVRSNLNDSIADPTELRTWLGNTRDLASDRMVVASYLQEGDSLHAFTLANLLPDLYGLQGNDLADHSDYMDLLRLYHSLYRENRTVFELDEAETTMIDSIANFGIGASKSMAKALLSELSDDYIITSYCPSMPEAQGNNSDRIRTSALYTNEHKNNSVKVSPNPATTWTVIDYILPQGFDKLSFTLTNMHGVQVLNTFFYGNQGQKTIDLQTVSPGIYFYTISYGEYAINGKIVITE